MNNHKIGSNESHTTMPKEKTSDAWFWRDRHQLSGLLQSALPQSGPASHFPLGTMTVSSRSAICTLLTTISPSALST